VFRALTAVLLLVLFFVAGCTKEDDSKPLITTTLPVWKSVAYYIGGRDFRYYSILKGGVSPHGYEPKPSDLEKEREASLVIVHGLGLDDWALEGADEKKVLNLGELFAKKYPKIKEPGYHLWMNPALMEEVYFEVAHRLTSFYPNRETYYAKRAEDYAAMIDQLIGRINDCLEGAEPRAVVVYHPVWKPLLETFGIEAIEIVKTPEERPSPERLRQVVEEAKKRGVKVVIGETFSDRKVPETVAKEVGAKLLILNPLPEGNYVKALAGWGEEICSAMKGQ